MQAEAETIDLGPLEKADLHAPLTPTKVPDVHTGKGSGPQVQPSFPVRKSQASVLKYRGGILYQQRTRLRKTNAR